MVDDKSHWSPDNLEEVEVYRFHHRKQLGSLWPEHRTHHQRDNLKLVKDYKSCFQLMPDNWLLERRNPKKDSLKQGVGCMNHPLDNLE